MRIYIFAISLVLMIPALKASDDPSIPNEDPLESHLPHTLSPILDIGKDRLKVEAAEFLKSFEEDRVRSERFDTLVKRHNQLLSDTEAEARQQKQELVRKFTFLLRQKEQSLGFLRKEKEELAGRIQRLEAEKTSLSEKVEKTTELTASIARLEEEQRALTAQVEEKEKTIAKVQKDKDDLEGAFRRFNEGSQKKEEESSTKLRRLEKENRDMNGQLESMQKVFREVESLLSQ